MWPTLPATGVPFSKPTARIGAPTGAPGTETVTVVNSGRRT